jgi:hypothetical protein
MKPFESGKVLAAWLLRIVMVFFVYQYYFEPFTDFHLKDFAFYISAAYLLFTLLLCIGGMVQKETLSVLSGLALFVIPVVQVIRDFPDDFFKVGLVYLIPLAIGFTFFSYGNNQ